MKKISPGAVENALTSIAVMCGERTATALRDHIAALEAEVERLADIAARSALLARETALEEAAAACAEDCDELEPGSETCECDHHKDARRIRALKSRPAREPEPGVADYYPEARKCTSKRCVTYEGRTFHALGCKLSEALRSDPDEKVTS